MEIASDANIARLRDAIKAKSASSLKDVDPIMIDIYASGTTSLEPEPENVIDPGDKVPTDTTSDTKNGKGPLIVAAPGPYTAGGKRPAVADPIATRAPMCLIHSPRRMDDPTSNSKDYQEVVLLHGRGKKEMFDRKHASSQPAGARGGWVCGGWGRFRRRPSGSGSRGARTYAR